MAKRRNPVVRHATILRKGGVHMPSSTGKRRRHKQELNDEVEQYLKQKTTSEKGAESDCPDQPSNLRQAQKLQYLMAA